MKFKELRGLFFSFILIVLDICLFIYGISLQDKMRMIVSILIVPIIIINALNQFYIRVIDDSMLIYNFIGPIALAHLIEFKDIQEISKRSNICILIHTKKKKYSIYILKANERFIMIKNKWEEYKNAQN